MSKKKKIIWILIVVAVLAGAIGIGVFYVVKDNKIKEHEEALKNIPFLGVKAEVIDSLFKLHSDTPLQVNRFTDEFCEHDFNTSVDLVSYKDLNQLRSDLDSSEDLQKYIILDLQQNLDSNIALEQLVLDIPFTVSFLSRISSQTGIQVFKIPALLSLPQFVDTTKLYKHMDSLNYELRKKGVLLATQDGGDYKSIPIHFVDFEVDSASFKDKQLQISEDEQVEPCLKSSSSLVHASKNTQRQLIALQEWIRRNPIERDTSIVDLNSYAHFFKSKTMARSFAVTGKSVKVHDAIKIYATDNLKSLKAFTPVRQIKKSIKYVGWDNFKTSSNPILIGLASDADSAKIAAINACKNALVIPLSNKAPLHKIKNAKVLPLLDVENEDQLRLIFQSIAGGGEVMEAEIFIEKTKSLHRNTLTYAKAIDVGLHPDSLRKINYLVQRALNGKAFPGCEVLVIKDGNIVWEKYYGKATYKPGPVIDANDVYDIASMTKVVATTMVAMKLYEQGHYKLDDPIRNYLPDTIVKYLPYKKHTIADITFRELLIHKSGLPSGAPIIQYLDYLKRKKLQNRFDAYYCDMPDDSLYNIEIAEGMYMDREYQDSMWIKLNSMFLHPDKPYKYSDVNMNLLYRLFDRMVNENKLVKKHPKDTLYNGFYQYYREQILDPLELKNTLYMPRRKKSLENIVPTENDRFWRKQLVHGYVHDPSAALMGGIAGNAGIFSNIQDLAILFQMLEQKGVYKDQKILNQETIQLFVNRQENSHRGLGFNKPNVTGSTFGVCDDASSKTYGHTGFTGTCFWTDPENGLIYVFLSNRVHPTVNKRIYQYGVRKGIHNIIYGSMLK